jgi:hypothetical protein
MFGPAGALLANQTKRITAFVLVKSRTPESHDARITCCDAA